VTTCCVLSVGLGWKSLLSFFSSLRRSLTYVSCCCPSSDGVDCCCTIFGAIMFVVGRGGFVNPLRRI